MNRQDREQWRKFQQDLSSATWYENQVPYSETGERRWVVSRGRGWPNNIEDGVYGYVVMPDGEVRFTETPRPESQMHHPELCQGREVVGAGMLRVVGGKIVKVDNESGHYAPAAESMYYVVTALRYWDAPLDDTLEVDTRWELFGGR